MRQSRSASISDNAVNKARKETMARVWLCVVGICAVVVTLSLFSRLSITETSLGQLTYNCTEISIKRLEAEAREAIQKAKEEGNLWRLGYAEGLGRAVTIMAFSLGTGSLVTRAQILQAEMQEATASLRSSNAKTR
jgi:hypothetical protein